MAHYACSVASPAKDGLAASEMPTSNWLSQANAGFWKPRVTAEISSGSRFLAK